MTHAWAMNKEHIVYVMYSISHTQHIYDQPDPTDFDHKQLL